ncbi:MAG: hypothetical protein N4A44_03315 [Alphaproteobacteria bacterium]|nr:hypothetical protein [Alphaproteobacteria bacterium]
MTGKELDDFSLKIFQIVRSLSDKEKSVDYFESNFSNSIRQFSLNSKWELTWEEFRDDFAVIIFLNKDAKIEYDPLKDMENAPKSLRISAEWQDHENSWRIYMGPTDAFSLLLDTASGTTPEDLFKIFNKRSTGAKFVKKLQKKVSSL